MSREQFPQVVPSQDTPEVRIEGQEPAWVERNAAEYVRGIDRLWTMHEAKVNARDKFTQSNEALRTMVMSQGVSPESPEYEAARQGVASNLQAYHKLDNDIQKMEIAMDKLQTDPEVFAAKERWEAAKQEEGSIWEQWENARVGSEGYEEVDRAFTEALRRYHEAGEEWGRLSFQASQHRAAFWERVNQLKDERRKSGVPEVTS